MTIKRKRTSNRHKAIVRPTRVTRRKISGLGGMNLTDPLLVGGGAIAGRFLDKLFPAMDAKLKAGGKIAIGILLPMVIKDPKSKKLLELLGYGLVATGSLELATSMNIISGIGSVNDLKDDDLLVVSLDGVDDDKLAELIEFEDVLNDDILNGDDIPVVSDDINVVQDDILNQI